MNNKAAERHGVPTVLYLELSPDLRRVELLALLWPDVDTTTPTLSATKAVHRYSGELPLFIPKGATLWNN